MEEFNKEAMDSSLSEEVKKEAAAPAAEIDAIRQYIEQINTELEAAAKKAKDAVAPAAELEAIKNYLHQISTEYEEAASEKRKEVSAMAEEIKADLEDRKEAFEADVKEAGEELKQSAEAAKEEVKEHLAEAGGEINEAMADLHDKKEEFEADVKEAAEEAADNIKEARADLHDFTEDIKEEMNDNVREAAGEELAQSADAVREEIRERAAEAAEEVKEEASEEAKEVKADLQKLITEIEEAEVTAKLSVEEVQAAEEKAAQEDIETDGLSVEPLITAGTPNEPLDLNAEIDSAFSEKEVKEEVPEAAPVKQDPPANMPPLPAKEEKKTAPETKKSQKQTKKKSGNVGTLLLAALLGLAGGFGGGYAAFKAMPSPEPVVVTAEPEQTATPEPVKTPEPTPVVISSPSIVDAASKAKPSVVEILIEEEVQGFGFFGGTYKAQGAGSGVIISEDGYIITNNHVVADAISIMVTLYDGKEYEATVVGTDEKSDIGVIKIDATNLIPATIGDSDTLQVGDTAIVIGNPLGTLGGTVTSGIISATEREVTIDNEAMNLIQTDATINSGNSGGGLFDENGDLVGIVNAKDSGTTSSGTIIEGLGFAIPVNQAMDVADQLITSGKVTNRATLGVYIQTLQQDTQQYKAGLYITGVMEGSGAEEAGLAVYDRIITADGTEVNSYQDLSKVLRKKKVGDTIDLLIGRDGEEMEVTVTLTGPIEESEEN